MIIKLETRGYRGLENHDQQWKLEINSSFWAEISMHAVPRKHFFIISRNSEAFASELLEILKKQDDRRP